MRSRHVFVGIVLMAVAFAGGVAGATVAGFTDVEDGQFYSDAVVWAKDTGITTGTSATTFEPLAPVTRGQMVAFLKRFFDTFIAGAAPVAKGGVVPGDGIWLIGTEVTPGMYRTTVPADSVGCYWARLSGTSGDFGDILANDTWGAGSVVTVTIGATDVAFESSRCGTWVMI